MKLGNFDYVDVVLEHWDTTCPKDEKYAKQYFYEVDSYLHLVSGSSACNVLVTPTQLRKLSKLLLKAADKHEARNTKYESKKKSFKVKSNPLNEITF